MSETRICANCGAEHPIDDIYQVEGDWLCEDCTDRLTAICDHCAERFYEENIVEDDTHTLCDYCFDEYYVRCEDCGRIIHRDRVYWDGDDNAYCMSCWDEHCEVIHEYSYTPDLVFHGKGLRHLGVELEIDDGGTVNSNAQKLLDIANANADNLYIKTNGSLDEGLELVTHPMTLEYHLNEMPWAEVLRFSRRTQSQMNCWAARYGIRLTPSEQMSHAKNSCAGRYTAVNLTNADTVEIRMFRGTLKLNTLKATLQMVNHLVEVAVSLSDTAVRELSWLDFLDEIKEPELIQYLKERRLYVNEPVSANEEE